MQLLGFNFTKINAENFENHSEQVQLEKNIEVLEIKQAKLDQIKTKEESLGITFSYTINYVPDFAKIGFKGYILISAEAKKAREILKEWEKKKLDHELKMFLFNIILRKSDIRALELEDQMNLPLHLPLNIVHKEPSSEKD